MRTRLRADDGRPARSRAINSRARLRGKPLSGLNYGQSIRAFFARARPGPAKTTRIVLATATTRSARRPAGRTDEQSRGARAAASRRSSSAAADGDCFICSHLADLSPARARRSNGTGTRRKKRRERRGSEEGGTGVDNRCFFLILFVLKLVCQYEITWGKGNGMCKLE